MIKSWVLKRPTIIKFISPDGYELDNMIYKPCYYDFKTLSNIFRFYSNRNFKIVKEK